MFFQQWFSDLQLNNHLQLIRIVFKVAFFLSFFFNFFQYFHGQARRSVFVFLIFFVIFNTINIWNKFSFVSNLSKIVYSTLCVFFFFSKREVQTTDFLFFLNRPFFKSISLNWAAWFLFFFLKIFSLKNNGKRQGRNNIFFLLILCNVTEG